VTGPIRRSTLIVLVTLGVTAGGSSAQASCPPLDAACQVSDVVGPGESLAGDTIDPVDDPVDDAIAPVVDTADPVVDEVLRRAEDLLGGSPVDPPDPIGGGDGGSHVGRVPPTGDDPRGASDPADRLRDVSSQGVGGSSLAGPAGPTVQAPSRPAPDTRTTGGGFGAALGGVARSLAVVAALFGLAVAFVAIQDRLDRNDPRLAIAPVESDLVEFA
jgi:hypothetical protein